jgi:hypothetical protein
MSILRTAGRQAQPPRSASAVLMLPMQLKWPRRLVLMSTLAVVIGGIGGTPQLGARLIAARAPSTPLLADGPTAPCIGMPVPC